MKKFGLWFLALCLVFSLAACGDSGESSSGSESGAVELTLWNDWTEDRPENDVYKGMVEKFNEENPDIKVVIESIPHDQYETKLRTQAAGQQLPDMFRIWPGTRMKPLAEGGALLSLNPIADKWAESIPENVLADYALDGEQYAIPGNLTETSLIFYQKDMVKEAGFEEFPKTYEELKSLIGSLNDQNVTPIALGNKSIWPLQSVYISTIADRFTGSEFLPKAMNGEASFTDDNFIQAISVIEELAEMKAFNEDFNTLDEAQARTEFNGKNAAMHFAGSWAIGPVLEGAENPDNIGVAAFPDFGGEGDTAKIAGVAGGGIALSSQLSEEKQDAAFKFLEYFYSDEMYQQLVGANLIVPSEVEMGGDVPAVLKDAIGYAQGGLSPVYDAMLTPELTDMINNGLQSVTLGEKTPEQLAEEMQQQAEQAE